MHMNRLRPDESYLGAIQKMETGQAGQRAGAAGLERVLVSFTGSLARAEPADLPGQIADNLLMSVELCCSA